VRDTLRSLSASLATFLAPGLLLLLLGIQMAFGLRGFDQPDGSLLYVLQVPGILLGWGAVAALLPLLVWMILDWWGYDLSGFALRGLGSAVLGIAVGTMAGLSGGEAAGGIVGGGLGSILSSTVGTTVAIMVLLLMAIPGGVLAFSLQQAARPAPQTPEGQGSPRQASIQQASIQQAPIQQAPIQQAPIQRAPGEKAPGKEAPIRAGWTGMLSRTLTRLTPKGYGAPEGDENAWYPEQRFDEAGEELPMDLGRARDVGGVRFASDDEESTESEPSQAGTTEAGTTEAGATKTRTGLTSEALPEADSPDASNEERLPTIPELLAGGFDLAARRYADDPSGGTLEPGEETSSEGPIHVGGDGRPVAPRAPAPRAAVPQARSPMGATPQEMGSQETGPQETGPQETGPQETGPQETEPETDPAPSDLTGTFPFAFPDPSISPDGPSPDGIAPHAPRSEDDDEAALAPGVRYAPLPPTARAAGESEGSGDASTAEPDKSGARKKASQKGDAKPGADDDTPPNLPLSIERAVRGPTPPERDPSHSAAVRSIRTNLRRSVAALQNEGPSERHLAKLDAIGMFDAFEAPPSEDPSASATPNTSAPQNTGAAAVTKKVVKKAAGKKATRQTLSATKPAAAKPRAGTRKAPTRKAPTRKAPTGKAPTGKARAKKPTRKSPPAPKAAARATNTAAKKKALLEALRIERLDPLFKRAVEAGLAHGGISPVLLTRRLGVPFARATGLLERLVASGVIEARAFDGRNALTITAEEWASLA